MNQYEELLMEYCAFIRAYNSWFNTPTPKLVTLEVEMPEEISAAFEIIAPEVKACYDNSFAALFYLKDASYCIGYTVSSRVPIAIEHAWIKYQGKYYDPTFLWHNRMSAPEDCAYGLVYEFSREKMSNFLKAQDQDDCYPPDLSNVHRFSAEKIAA